MIAVLDYGIGNIGSIRNMLMKAGENDVEFVYSPEQLVKAEKIILPGVGSFDMGMELLNRSGMRCELDKQIIENRKPILGICLGMQMMGKGSEEGKRDGLGYLNFKCQKFRVEHMLLKVPHMGWDYVKAIKENPLVCNLGDRPRFYFVHSYHAVCEDEEDILLKCEYGYEFAVAIQRENIYGTQFHPEKSHKFGMQLLKNFIKEL